MNVGQPSAIELIEQLNALDEHERIEAKRGSELGRSVMETICAFANEPGLGGGTLLLGVERDEADFFLPWQIVGVEQPERLSAELASRGLRRGALRRIGSTDQECTEEDLLVLYQGRQIESFDASLMPDAQREDIDPDAVADYRRSLAEANPSAEAIRFGDDDLLHALGALRRDAGQPGQPLRPTIAGIVLFGKPLALRRLLPMVRIEYIRVPGKEWVGDPARRFDSVDIRDPLLRAVRRALAAVLDDLPKSFHLPEGAIERRDIPLLPANVVREAIVNAVMHRSYRVQAAVQIIRYANRLEVRNPGFSLKPVEHLGEPGSQVRNTRIANVLYDTRLAETKGTGVGAMRRLMEGAGLESPLFASNRAADNFIATYYFQHFLSEEAIAWLSRFKDLKLTDEEAKALVAVREQGAIDNAMYRELNRVDTLAASQTLRRLRDVGLLEQKGRGSATYYVPTPRLLPPVPHGEGASVEPVGLPSNPGGLSSNPPGLSSNPPTLSSNPSARNALLAGVPAPLALRLGALGRRHPPDEVRAVVVELCRLRPWRAEELATVLQRNVEHIRQNYLRPLLREQRIALTHPDEPNDPQQAYRAIDGGEGRA